MKRFFVGFAITCLLFLTVAGAVSAASGTDYKSLAQTVSTGLKSVFQDENAQLKKADVAGVILGETIYSQEFEIRAKMYELAGSKTPYTDTWDSFKVQMYEHQYAEDHNILPSQEEIEKFSSDMRKDFESSPEGKEVEKILLDGMGMTADEYWNDYKIKYEAPAHLTKIKIHNYVIQNGLPEIDEKTVVTDTLIEKMNPAYEDKI